MNQTKYKLQMKDFFTNFNLKMDLEYVKLLFRILKENNITQEIFNEAVNRMFKKTSDEVFRRPTTGDWIKLCIESRSSLRYKEQCRIANLEYETTE